MFDSIYIKKLYIYIYAVACSVLSAFKYVFLILFTDELEIINEVTESDVIEFKTIALHWRCYLNVITYGFVCFSVYVHTLI